MWWLWIVVALVGWFGAAVLVAVMLGRGIRLADERSPLTGRRGDGAPAGLPVAARVRAPRRRIPLPPVGIALAAAAVALEFGGYLVRISGHRGSAAQVLSMDAPYSLPRLFVAGLFAAGALAAVAGAGRIPGRRTWWLAVGSVAGCIAAVKAGSTVHADVLHALDRVVGGPGALLVSAGLATAVVGGLWFLSRKERRDRRRVLGVLSLYAVAAVGLSALSSWAATALPGNWAAAATFVEESGEALAGVAFLVAVLVGVAPRLVLPGAWALRRSADAHTLELPEAAPGGQGVGWTARG